MKIKLNENFKNLSKNYLFTEVAQRVERFRRENPDSNIISLGIGDVSLPLPRSVSMEMARASIELGKKEGFRGYGDTQGDSKLRGAICDYYAMRGVSLLPNEIFINDGAKSDLANLGDLLGDNETLIFDPVYPVYLDSSIISGRRVTRFFESEGSPLGSPPTDAKDEAFVIYLCSPNNPTGAVLSRAELKLWVDFARKSGSLIIFDAAYESYISEPDVPHSIFELEGARECAVEVCSFSKMAGFTGVRCGWTAIARENPLYEMWRRRQSTKFNGASCISQRGALAVLTPRGLSDCRKNIDYYMENARSLAKFFERMGVRFSGGKNAPYLWVRCPDKVSSWQFFEYLLTSAAVVCTPGVGFGTGGEGYVRFSAFASREDTLCAIARLDKELRMR